MNEPILMTGKTKMYGRDRRAAVMGIINDSKTELTIGMAICSEKDQFSRKEAKRLITQRLEEDDKGLIMKGDFSDMKTAKRGVWAVFEVVKAKPEQFFKPYHNSNKRRVQSDVSDSTALFE